MKIHIKKYLYVASILLPLLLLAEQTSKNIQTKSPNDGVKKLATFYTVDGNIEDQYNAFIEEKLRSIGFNVTDPHKRINDHFETKWGSTTLDILTFMPVLKESTILPLLNIEPRIAGFSPFNLLMYKKRTEDVTHIGHLEPEAVLNILNIQNKEVRKKFSMSFKALDASISNEFGADIQHTTYTDLPEKPMIHFEYEFSIPDNVTLDAFKDEFQNKFELAFIDKGYLIAGYHDFFESTNNAKEILSNYSAFWTYSLCHLEFSYQVFDTQGARPDAALFAPCSMYMYIEKESKKVVLGMFRLQNIADTLPIRDTKRLNFIKKLDSQIPEILTHLGMKEVLSRVASAKNNSIAKQTKPPIKQIDIQPTKTVKIEKETNTLPGDYKVTLPSVPKAIQLNTSESSINPRSIKFSKRIPPNYRPNSFDREQKAKKSTNTRIGEVNKGKVSAYLRGPFMEVTEVEKVLKSAKFNHIASLPINKDKTLTSVIFTNNELVTLASKSNRGFIASLRVLVDTKEKTISITNPLYMSKGFLQEHYDDKVANKTLVQLIEAFSNLTNSEDSLKFQLLPKYQFMQGMPKYENMIEVASGDDLLEKIKENKRVLFTQTLSNGSTLIGIQLSKRTNKFIKRIGRNNASILPYPILIEEGKAKILDPKYYISFMYPKLTMSEFMKIATIPDAMKKDCERVFK
ncbi:MAG: Unknown protein [uncultured Sulfurovum sp.]|uniref:Uncharacterized protein n=1 Tax=uncultured Sulfurovum sp. TaxID=269237 RepID=A0A6S6T1V8_9BACT|nr:MAG: Unknown protein [uncultured Sulfurovum sp.]